MPSLVLGMIGITPDPAKGHTERRSKMNYRPMVKVGNEWCGNALVFATKKEAEESARALMWRWMAVTDTRAEETEAAANAVGDTANG